MKVLITGAAGFLGSNLCDEFISRGHEVIGLDDLSTGSLENISHLQNKTRFKFVEQDVRKPFSAEVDLILNFACPASPKHYQSDPVRTIETNFIGIINMLHLAKEKNSILLQASTSEVYGDPAISPQPESYWGNVNPIGVRSCYDEGKRAAETLCFDYRRQYGLDTRVIRIFNTHGPRMAVNDGRVVSNLVVQALLGQDLTLYGDGQQTRSFCYVTDLISGIYKMSTTNIELNQPVNLGNPETTSMKDLAQIIIQETGSNSKIVFQPLPEDDPKQRKPDITRARELLGWEPTIDLRQGIAQTIDYFRKKLSIN
jgi:UDP-glucuronate decarboxylase